MSENLPEQVEEHYVPGEMSEELLLELREHLASIRSSALDVIPPDPVQRAMQAGSLARQAYTRSAREAIMFLLPITAEGTDAFSLVRDLDRRARIPTSYGQFACDFLYRSGQLIIDSQHRYVLAPTPTS